MRAGKVLMKSPKYGQAQYVDPSEVEFFKSKNFTVISPPKSDMEGHVAQLGQDARRFAGAAIPIAAATGVGALLGGPAGAGIGMARGLALEGAAAGAGSIAGQMVENPDRPVDFKRAGTDALITAGTGGVGRAMRAGIRAVPRPAMKSALGRALPGMEDEALQAGQVVSNEGLAARKAVIKAAGDEAQSAIENATRKFDWRVLKRSVAGLRRTAQKSDLASKATESALGDVLGVLEGKVGPKVTEIAESAIMAPGRGGLRATSGPAREASRTVEAAKPMTARDLEGIRKYADDKVTRFREARAANNDKVVGADESAYIKISDTARRMLATIPEVKAARAKESSAIRLYDAVFDALQRAPNRNIPITTGLAGGYAGLFGDPIAAIPGMAVGAGLGMAGSSPQGLSRIALTANRPAVQESIKHLPRAIQLLIQANMDRGQ